MAAERYKNFQRNLNIRKIQRIVGKITNIGKTVLGNGQEGDWIIIDEKELTPEKLEEFVRGRGRKLV